MFYFLKECISVTELKGSDLTHRGIPCWSSSWPHMIPASLVELNKAQEARGSSMLQHPRCRKSETAKTTRRKGGKPKRKNNNKQTSERLHEKNTRPAAVVREETDKVGKTEWEGAKWLKLWVTIFCAWKQPTCAGNSFANISKRAQVGLLGLVAMLSEQSVHNFLLQVSL